MVNDDNTILQTNILSMITILQIHNKEYSMETTKLTRSKMTKLDIMKWLKSRYKNQMNEKRQNQQYLKTPEMIAREKEIQKIFHQFDIDGSGGLSQQQVFSMFQGFGIHFPMEKLKDLYDSIEQGLNDMDLKMFKMCALSEKSNEVFRQIAKKLEGGDVGYVPTKFTQMITYLVYLTKRQQLMKQISDKKTTSSEKVQSLSGLLKLRELQSNNKEVMSQTQKMKKQLKNRFWDVWDRVANNMGMVDLIGQRNMSYISEIKQIIETKASNLGQAKNYQSGDIHHALLREKSKLLNLQKIRFSDPA